MSDSSESPSTVIAGCAACLLGTALFLLVAFATLVGMLWLFGYEIRKMS